MAQEENSPSVRTENERDSRQVENSKTATRRFWTVGKFSCSSCQLLNFVLLCVGLCFFGILEFRILPSLLNKGNISSSQPEPSAPPRNKNLLVPVSGAIVDVDTGFDQNVDPCDDFYEFACGPPNSKTQNSSQVIDDLFTSIENFILEHSQVENSAEEKAQNFYKSCVKAAAHLESMALNEELSKMLEKLEKIPHENLQEKLELLQNEYGLSPFFALGVDRDATDCDKNVIQIAQKESSIFGVYDSEEAEQFTRLLNESAHYKTMMAEILGNRLDFTDKSSDFEQLVNLETEIRGLMQPPLSHEYDVMSRYNLMNLTQLQNLAGFINWKKFFNSGFQKLNMTIEDTEKIVVLCPQFLSKLSKKLKHLQNSPEGAKLLNKYLIFAAGKELLGEMFLLTNLSSEAIAENSTLTTVVMTTCSTITQQNFDPAVASLQRRQFLKYYPDLESKSMETVQEMAENIRDELILVLKEAEWLDKKSREKAIHKARKIRLLIGFPEGVKNSTLLEQHYKFCPKMNESDFLGNVIKFFRVENQKSLQSLRNPVDKTGTFGFSNDMQIMGNNAFNIQDLNILFIPMRNLLPPNFSANSSESFNYGRIGYRIGHEFFHAFSKFGSKWDGDGKFLSQNPNQNQSLWQTEEVRKEMENRSSCLIRQYSKFSYPDGKFLNGRQTLEENFADNGGLDITTRAFFRLFNKKNMNANKNGRGKMHEKNKKINGFSGKQFFISAAQLQCTNDPPEFSKDPHSPEKFRILGALQNSKAFSKAFNCPSKSRMNPPEKCSIF